MRLHRLVLTAFGSFPGEEEVDFDALGEAGLFLIHGPTGAGKTTVLDAVCYALYGRVPGQRDNARSLRCDHAPAGRGPSVVLEATIRERRFRVTRSPAWRRPKQRGTGTVEEKAKVLLEELTGEWTARSTRADEAGHMIGELLGMNADQFWQVAMLPQGDFARFLRADGDDRRRLLERLFSVKIFTDVEKWLADHRTRTGREQEELRQVVDSVVNRMRGAAGDELLAEVDADVEAEADPASWSGALLGAAQGALARAAEASTASLATLASARARLEEGRTLADRQRRHAGALARRDELERAAEERSDLESILDEAARADRVLPLIRRARQRAEAAAKARRLAADAVDRALPLIARLQEPADAAWVSASELDGRGAVDRVLPLMGGSQTRPDADWLSALERDRRDEIARLEQLLPEEPRLAAVRSGLCAAERRMTDLAGEEGRIAERLAVLPIERKQLVQRLAAVRVAAAQISGLRAGRDTARRDLVAVRHRDARAADLATAVRARTSALAALRLPEPVPAEQTTASVFAKHPTASVLAELERAGRDELARLQLLASEEIRLNEVRDQLAVARAELTGLADREAAVLAGQADLPATLLEAGERLTQVRAGIARIAGLEAACHNARERLDAVVLRDALTSELGAAEQIRQAAVDEAQELRDRLQDLRRARIDGMAAELGRELIPGEPCRVCGSMEHPDPAAPADSAPTAQDEEAAQDAFESARQGREEAENHVVRLSSRLDEVAFRADGLSQGEAESLLAAVEAELTEVHEAVAAEPMISAEVERLTAELDGLRDDAEEVGRSLAERRAQESELVAEHQRLTARLAEARGEDVSVGARRDRLADETALLVTAIDATRRATDAQAAYDEAAAAITELIENLRQRLHARHEEDLRARSHARPEEDPRSRPHPRHQEAPEPALAAISTPGVSDVMSSEAAGAVEEVSEDLAARMPGGVEEGSRSVLTGVSSPGVSDVMSSEAVGAVEEVSEDLVARMLGEAEETLRQALEMAAEEPVLASEVERLDIEIAEAEALSRRTALEAAETRALCGQLAEQESRLAAILEAACGADASVSARLERLADEAALLADAAEAMTVATGAWLEKDAAFAEAESAAAEAGFATSEDVSAAVRTDEEREALAERLGRFAGEQAAVTELLDDPELAMAAAAPAPDLVAIESAHEQAEREHAARTSARDRAQGRSDQLIGLAKELDDANRRHGPAAERHRLARRLAELTGGTSADNQWNMRLSSYVLGERLRQVVEAANERLDRMSGGRYLLQHDMRKVAGDRGRSGGGLGLRVLDGWTGVDRDPATLSGGESFVTSLALALGLADVVTAEAGGAEIGSLFVDEGFGTLDEDTLEDVLDILDGLREGGRAVGIVSHVAELRARVPARLQVIKGRSGSTLRG